MLFSSCSFKNGEEPQDENAELIINENNSVFKLVAEEGNTMVPVCGIPQSLADALSIAYEPLYDFDEELNPVPVLAKSCIRSDRYQYKVELNKGILWHDGSEFTANDVIYTVNVLKTSGGVYSDLADCITQVDIISRYKVLFTLNEPTFNFEGLLTFPIIKRNTPTEAYSDPMGTGPYKFREKKNNTYIFEKNPDWHGASASDKTIELTLLKDSRSAVYAFEAGEADAIGGSLVDLTKNTPKGKIEILDYVSRNLTFIGMNTAEGILSLPEMRKAVSYVIDKNEIVQRDVYGRAETTDVPVYSKAWFCPEDFGNIEISSDDGYMERVLNENDWQKNNGRYKKDFGGYETELTLSILVNSDNEEKVNIAKSVAEMLEEAGLNIRIKALPYDRYLAKIKEKDFSMFIGEIAVPANMDPTGLVKGGENYFLYSDEATDEIIGKLNDASEKEEIKSLFGEFLGKFSEQMPFVPLFFRKYSMIYTFGLAGFGKPDYLRPFKNIENWYFSQKVELNNP